MLKNVSRLPKGLPARECRHGTYPGRSHCCQLHDCASLCSDPDSNSAANAFKLVKYQFSEIEDNKLALPAVKSSRCDSVGGRMNDSTVPEKPVPTLL